MTAAARYYERLAPIAYDDHRQGNVLEAFAAALMAPREIFEVARASDTHEIPWGRLLDPDACPADLLDWLAVSRGVEFPPSALTESEKRYRLKQAAGRYRCTPRAVVEEMQLVLTGSRTVLLGFHAPDQWRYLVGTIAGETPDLAAVNRAVQAQKPVGMLATALRTTEWTWFVLAPTLIAERVDDQYTIREPDYPTWQSVIDNFATWQDLVDNTPNT